MDLAHAASLVSGSSTIAVLTGAGMSAESGVPTFRDPNVGLWQRYSFEELATPAAWKRDKALVWGWYLWRMAVVRKAAPNAGHLALARAAPRKNIRIVTQNVDDLHERAGSADVLHLHGGLFAHRCAGCARPHADVAIPDPDSVPQRVDPPRCTHCGGWIRPGVVWFGEPLPDQAMTQATAAIDACDLLLVIGTSGEVMPAAMLPEHARRRGVPVIVLNPAATRLGAEADLDLRVTAAAGLPVLLGGDGDTAP